MPPQDTFRPFLRDHIKQLKESVPNHVVAKASNPLDTYIEKIDAWLKHLTPEQLERSYTIREIIMLCELKGINQSRASVQITGEALRRCGVVPVRDWSKKGRNKRYWKAGKHD